MIEQDNNNKNQCQCNPVFKTISNQYPHFSYPYIYQTLSCLCEGTLHSTLWPQWDLQTVKCPCLPPSAGLSCTSSPNCSLHDHPNFSQDIFTQHLHLQEFTPSSPLNPVHNSSQCQSLAWWQLTTYTRTNLSNTWKITFVSQKQTKPENNAFSATQKTIGLKWNNWVDQNISP